MLKIKRKHRGKWKDWSHPYIEQLYPPLNACLSINVFCFTARVAWPLLEKVQGLARWSMVAFYITLWGFTKQPDDKFPFTTSLPQELEDIMHPTVLVLIKFNTSNCCLALLRYFDVRRNDISTFLTVGFSLYCMFVFCFYAWSPVCKLQFVEDLEFVRQGASFVENQH